ncbi:UDP-N-acetylmuramoyl-tripeptide--D-alanyl-D-alanine ligase, partial [Chlamydiales bacterium SCGC AB-751-O23]
MDLKLFASFLNFHDLTSSEKISGFFIDSRQLIKDGVFFALKGEQVDGHDFISIAFEKGALLCVVEEDRRKNLPKGGRYLFVKDTLKALQQAAGMRFDKENVALLGVTGSIGKTTTKNFLYDILKDQIKTYVSPRSYNSQITFPLNILNAPPNQDLWILEMGLSQKHEMEKLVSIAAPNFVLLTPIVASHLAFFNDLKEIALEKAKIFSKGRTQWALMMEDSFALSSLLKIGTCEKEVISMLGPLFSILDEEEGKLVFKKNLKQSCSIGNIQKQHRENLLLSVHAAYRLGLSFEQISQKIPSLGASQGRFSLLRHEGVQYIDDTYNAAPFAVLKAIENIPKPKGKGRKLALLGDMMELGSNSDHEHEEVLQLALKELDLVITLGKSFKKAASQHFPKEENIKSYESFDEALTSLQSKVKPGDSVLVKGARVFKLERVFKQ